MKKFFKSLACLAVAAPMLFSCYDDSAIWDKFDEVNARIDSLANELNKQAAALDVLLQDDSSTVTSIEENADGSYILTLSNGMEFTVLSADADFSALVSFVVVDGVKCWATYDANGELVPLKDAEGNVIPVVNEIDVEVKIKDGAYVLVINGKEYITGYEAKEVVQIVTGCTPLKDASGNTYAVKLEVGDGFEVTIPLDGYNGVIFKLPAGNTNKVVAEYYVGYGETESFLFDAEGVIDYVMQVPDGWRVAERVVELTGEKFIDITAPSEETVELGAAVATGDLKVVSVVEGGKAAVSKLTLSADPFAKYDVTPMKAVIDPYEGIQKFAYGIMLTDDFSASALIEKINSLVTSNDEIPAGYNISETAVDKTLAEIYGEELSVDLSYVFWCVPVLFSDGDDASYYVKEDMLRTLVLAPINASIEVTSTELLDAQIKVKVDGTLSMYAGTMPYVENFAEEIVYQINNKSLDPITESLKYTGTVSGFPKEGSLEMDPATEYVVWVVPVDDDKTTYTEADVVYKKFETKDLASGGTLALTAGDITATASSLTSVVSSEGAVMIYYAYLDDADGKRYSTAENEMKMSKILASPNCVSARGSSLDAVVKGLRPETTMWLYAAAVDKNGLYGEVVCKSAQTGAVSFNDLSLSLTEDVKATKATFTISVSGGTATDFIYWLGYEGDQFWKNDNFCGESTTQAEAYLAANPDSDYVMEAMKKYGKVSADGMVSVDGLSLSTTYIFIALAKDETGKYSKAVYKKFTTLAADFGNVVVTGSEKWNATKKLIEDSIDWKEESFKLGGQTYSSYKFDVSLPTDHTAYLSCFSTLATKTYEVMLEVENMCMERTITSPVVYDENGDTPTLPKWVSDEGKEYGGHLLNVTNFFPHGTVLKGLVTIFPSTGHNEHSCQTWDNGECSNYAHQAQTIENYLSFDYWKAYVIDHCNYDDPQYGYHLTDPAKIDALAQAYVDTYYPYYKDAKPTVYVNEGKPFLIENHSASGLDSNGNVADEVIIVLKDAEGNYYEPMYIEVPNHYN